MSEFTFEDYYDNQLLTCGKMQGNFVFLNCSNYILSRARQRLPIPQNRTTPSVIELTMQEEESVELAMKRFSKTTKQAVANAYINSKIILNLLASLEQNPSLIKRIMGQKRESLKNISEKLVQAIERAKKSEIETYLPVYPKRDEFVLLSDLIGYIELDFLLDRKLNEQLQKAINNSFFYSRKIFSKIYSATDELTTYEDENKRQIPAPHSYGDSVLVD